MTEAPLALPPYLGVAQTRYGTMIFPKGDVWVGRSLAVYGEYSEGETALFRQILRAGDTVVEAGANIGGLTLPLAGLVGARGRVLAFEAQRPIHAVLTTNLMLNGLQQVWAERVALGAAAGNIKVPLLDLSRTGNFGGISTGGDVGEDCPLVTLDSYGLQSLKLIKIDVEGAESEVIDGARHTITRTRPVLYVENDRKEKSAALIARILDLGYRLWWHVVPLYSPHNPRGNAENVFGNISSLNMACLPRESGVTFGDGTEILSPDAPPPF
ncbi:SAM-dependent methyltransferase [Paramagnetospirillum magnetotacticum MS-1]|uniref:SAM-dependent methyltransferase n=1 Tax=Paramagnetospirillum magnetotacticum MS-1 TaxID=272627 RepID=A0A0C2YGZ8_PARME|nr:FkbM family methyltransferase [Paramagnetospirillum magnetotacticum]KIL99004.1 SAM-dependent methyltransferase [Paramagnetospirillum magnetotacticum MS-1]